MNRRDALQKVAWLRGGVVSAPTVFAVLEGCKPAATSTSTASEVFALSSSDQNLLAELAEVIIPKTNTPGAKEAGVGPFIELMLKDCYSPIQQAHFQQVLKTASEEAKKLGGEFVSLTADQKNQVMKLLSTMAKDEAKANAAKQEEKVVDSETGTVKENQSAKDVAEVPTPFFNLLKELTLFGYFTSEAGSTKALDYVPIPGRYDACIYLKPDQKAYAI